MFDLFPEARALVTVEALREDECAPVKHADGGESPASAPRALAACARRSRATVGWTLPPPTVALEVEHSVIDGPEDAAPLTVRDAAAAGPVVRLGPGVLP